jgi:type 1 fimbria pilin
MDRVGCSLLLLMIFSHYSYGVEVEFTGNLIDSPPCIINQDNDITVDFGNNLAIPLIDGVKYKKNIDYFLDCSSAQSSDLKMKLSGSPATFDSDLLKVNESNHDSLGIKLLVNGSGMAINQTINFNSLSPPVLEVVPIKDSSGTLTTGEFSSFATLAIEYQ